MSKPKAPTPPDPKDTINAQTASNVETARESNRLGMMDKTTPTGSLKYVIDPNSPSGYRAIEELSPQEQAKLEQNQILDLKALGLAGSTLDDVTAMGPLNLDSAGKPISEVPLQDMERIGKAPGAELAGNMPGLERVGNAAKGATVGPADAMARAGSATAQEKASMGMLPDFKDLSGAGEGIQKDLDYSSLGDLPEANDATRQRVEDAVYGRQTARLDPQFQAESAALSSKLVNSGVPLGSRAHQQSMREFADAKEKAYSGARNDAITMGGAEQSRLIADALGIRRQGAGEIENAGGFHNAAQGQGFGQNLAQTEANNANQRGELDANLAILGQRNQAGQQDFQNQFAVTEQGNKATQQEFENNMAGAGFNNQVGSTDLANALASTGQRNAATGSEYDADMAGVNQRNQARGNEYQQNMQGTQMNNQAAQQEINNLFANANMSNAQRQQAIQEIMLKYNAPLQRYSTLTSGAAPMMPNFANLNFNPTQVANTDVAGITQAGYTNQMGAHNANVAQGNFLPSMIGSLGGAALGGPVGAAAGKALFSDRRLKRDIVPRGTMSSGLPWYSYTLFGVPEVGVMADEARVLFPAAVRRGSDGYDRVDYSQLH